MDIRELLQKRASLVAEAERILADHTDADNKISAVFADKVDKLLDDVEALDANIARFQKIGHYNAELSKPFNQPHFEPFNSRGGHNLKQAFSGVRGDDYRKNFLNAIRTNFKNNATDFLREGSLVDGGYLLPVEMHDTLISKLESENVLRQIGKTITTMSEHRISILTTAPTASWLAEGEEIATSNAQFGQTSLNAYKLAVNLKISNELLQDSYYDLESFISDEYAKSLGRAEEEAFLTGALPVSGDQKQPIGLLTVLNQSATTLQTVGNEITADDILTLIYSLDRAYRKSAVFLASDTVIMNLRKLKTADGNFIWQPSLQEGEPSRIFGVPLFSATSKIIS